MKCICEREFSTFYKFLSIQPRIHIFAASMQWTTQNWLWCQFFFQFIFCLKYTCVTFFSYWMSFFCTEHFIAFNVCVCTHTESIEFNFQINMEWKWKWKRWMTTQISINKYTYILVILFQKEEQHKMHSKANFFFAWNLKHRLFYPSTLKFIACHGVASKHFTIYLHHYYHSIKHLTICIHKTHGIRSAYIFVNGMRNLQQ